MCSPFLRLVGSETQKGPADLNDRLAPWLMLLATYLSAWPDALNYLFTSFLVGISIRMEKLFLGVTVLRSLIEIPYRKGLGKIRDVGMDLVLDRVRMLDYNNDVFVLILLSDVRYGRIY
jgi:hypothetical protein